MIQRIPARLFLFGSMHPVDWMTADEIAGMENLIMRADCHGGQQDIFLLCLKQRTVLFRLEPEAESDSLQALGFSFPAADRQFWYYIPELISTLLQVLETQDCMDSYASQPERKLTFQTEKLEAAAGWLREEHPALMQAVVDFREDTKKTLYPHSVAFTRLAEELYGTEGIVFYRYLDAIPTDRASGKTLEPASGKNKQPSLYLKPPRILNTWLVSDLHEKVKITGIRESQKWHTLHEKIMRTWEEQE